MSNAQPPPGNPTELCANCKFLQFDDLAHGGYGAARDPPDGSGFLLFSENDHGQEFSTPYESQDDLPDLPALARSAALGCSCCAGIRAAIRHSGSPMLERAAKVTLSFSYLWKSHFGSTGAWANPNRGLVAARLYMHSTSEGGIGQNELDTFIFSIETASESCLKWLRTRPLASQHPLSPRNVAWIQKNLAQDTRKPGMSSDDAGFLPTRLIDLGASDAHTPRVSLQMTESLQSTEGSLIKYAALSYCWGSQIDAARQFQTTRATLSQRRAEITVSETSPVIQDAVAVCRALGFRYLWIDAVCIVQDNAQAWEREASRMHGVYGNASATICALASSSCMQHFLVDREAGFTIPFASRVREGVRGVLNLRCCMRSEYGLTHGDQPILKDFIEAAWDLRAWTFQEYHLSQKLIMFCRQRLYITDKLGTTGEAETFVDEHLTPNPCVASIEEAASAWHPESGECPLLNRQWMDLVANYSMRQLSDKTDALPALSGLASLYRKLLREDDEYIAGIWRNDLHRQLFWTSHSKHRGPLGQRLFSLSHLLLDEPYIAPSWSWISNQQQRIEFGCRTVHMTNMDYADCVREFSQATAHLTLKGLDSYGELASASLEIKARLLSADALSPEYERLDAWDHPFWRLEDSTQSYVATCNLDWDDPEANETGNLGAAWSSLSLLLLGSYDETYTDGLSSEEDYNSYDMAEGSSDDNEDMNAAEGDTKGDAGDTCGPKQDVVPGRRGDGNPMDEEDTSPDDVGGSCAAEKEENDGGWAEGKIAVSPATKQETLWGLVICPAIDAAGSSKGDVRTFYRVGIFYTERGRGARLRKLLKNCEASTISLM